MRQGWAQCAASACITNSIYLVTALESNMKGIRVEFMGKAHHSDPPGPRKHTLRKLNPDINLSCIFKRKAVKR